MVFAVLLISILWLFHVILLEVFYKQTKTATIKNTADVISTSFANLNEIDMYTLSNLVSDVAMKNEISIKIIDSSSSSFFTPVFSVIADQDNLLSHLRDSELYFIYKDALENGGRFEQHYQRGAYTMFIANKINSDGDSSESDFPQYEGEAPEFEPHTSIHHGPAPFFKKGITQELLYASIVTRADGKEFFLLFDSVITPISSTVTTLKNQLIFQSVLIFAGAAIIATLLAKKIVRPITDINSSAKQLAAGNYDTEFSGGGYLEISQLADTLNYTAKELKQADALKRELISNTSHDLRTPLTMIIGYAEVMRDLPGENTPENVQVIIDEASRLNTLVNDMLDLSKLQSENAALDYNEFNITLVTESIIERMRNLTEKDGFRFDFKKDGNAFVNADEVKITQVIYNFLSNAVNYSGNSREISVVQTTSHNKVRLEFIDRGCGIPKEKLPNIWDRYYKIDKSHKRSDVGSGIGLSIVKTILELHKAKYGVKSSPEGSTFWFELPVTEVIR